MYRDLRKWYGAISRKLSKWHRGQKQGPQQINKRGQIMGVSADNYKRPATGLQKRAQGAKYGNLTR
jgi:hypothetical protein